MGQKINPNSFRLGITKNWPVRWFLKGGYAKFLEEDEAIREVIEEKIGLAGIAGIEIEPHAGPSPHFHQSGPSRFHHRLRWQGHQIPEGRDGRAQESPEGEGRDPDEPNVEEPKRTEISAAYIGQQIARI